MRKVKVKRKSGEIEEIKQYYHRYVVEVTLRDLATLPKPFPRAELAAFG